MSQSQNSEKLHFTLEKPLKGLITGGSKRYWKSSLSWILAKSYSAENIENTKIFYNYEQEFHCVAKLDSLKYQNVQTVKILKGFPICFRLSESINHFSRCRKCQNSSQFITVATESSNQLL